MLAARTGIGLRCIAFLTVTPALNVRGARRVPGDAPGVRWNHRYPEAFIPQARRLTERRTRP